jgi:hypothetical protein
MVEKQQKITEEEQALVILKDLEKGGLTMDIKNGQLSLIEQKKPRFGQIN